MVLVSVPAGSALAKAGMKAGEVIVRVDGKKVGTVDELLARYAAAKAGEVELGVYRDQALVKVRLPRAD